MAKHYTYIVSLNVPISTHNEVDVEDIDVLRAFQFEALKMMRDPEQSTWIKVTLGDTQEYACPYDAESAEEEAAQVAAVPLGPLTAIEQQVADLLAGLGEEV